MDIARERTLWRAAGCLASVVALGFFIWCQVLFYDAADMAHRPMRAGVAGAFCLLAGIGCFVAARILGVIDGKPEGVRAAAWKIFAYGSIPLGGLIIGVELWRGIGIHPLTSNMKAVYTAGAFVLMAGILGLIGERVVAHMRGAPVGPRSHAKAEVLVA